jgi:hypothetical protein
VASTSGVAVDLEKELLYLIALRQFLGWMGANDKLPSDFSWRKAEARYKASTGKRAGTRYRARTPDDNLLAIIDHYDRLQLPGELTRTAHLRRLDILRDRALLHALYATAGRVSEVLSLNRKGVAGGSRSRAEISGKGKKCARSSLAPKRCKPSAPIWPSVTATTWAIPVWTPDLTLFISHRKMAGTG